MGRIIALDYGLKRTGIAVTDSLKLIASPLTTVESATLLDFLRNYFVSEEVERIVVGLPRDLMNRETHGTKGVQSLLVKLSESFPTYPVSTVDERFTSKMAKDSMLAGGMKKKERARKENVDKISATLILQSYLTQNL